MHIVTIFIASKQVYSDWNSHDKIQSELVQSEVKSVHNTQGISHTIPTVVRNRNQTKQKCDTDGHFFKSSEMY